MLGINSTLAPPRLEIDWADTLGIVKEQNSELLHKGITIFWVSLDIYAGEYTLSDLEHSRACRYSRNVDRNRFVAARSALRHVLATETGSEAGSLIIQQGQFGKPYLPEFPWLHFSLTHSSGLAGVAVSKGRPVGIDCEMIQPFADLDDLIRGTCSDAEQSVLQTMDSDARLRNFYRMWTRKEAALKASGVGLKYPPKKISTTTNPEPARNILNLGEHGIWELVDLYPPPEYVASIAVEPNAPSNELSSRRIPTELRAGRQPL